MFVLFKNFKTKYLNIEVLNKHNITVRYRSTLTQKVSVTIHNYVTRAYTTFSSAVLICTQTISEHMLFMNTSDNLQGNVHKANEFTDLGVKTSLGTLLVPLKQERRQNLNRKPVTNVYGEIYYYLN